MNFFCSCLLAFARPAGLAVKSDPAQANATTWSPTHNRLLLLVWAVAIGTIVGCDRPESSKADSPQAESPQVKTAKTPIQGANRSSGQAEATELRLAPQGSTQQLPEVADQPEAQAAARAAEPARLPVPPMKLAPADGPELRAEAAQFFEQLVERVPNNPDALEVKARFHLLIGQSKAAKESWEEALRLAPDYAYAYHGLGKVAMLNAEHEQAVAYFQKAMPGLSGHVDLAHDLADAYTKLGKVDEAIELLSKAAEEHPQSTATWVQLGHAYLADRDFGEARDAFERALSLTPDLPRAQQGLGTALMRLGERDKAKALLESQRTNRVAGKNRSTEETFADELAEVAKRYVFAARVYLAHGDHDRTEYALRRATIFQPREESAWALLLSYYQNQQRLGDAIDAADEMCRLAPDNPSYHYTLGVLCSQARDVAKARREFQEVIRLAPQSVEGYQALVRLLLGARQDWDQCIELAQKCVELRGAASDYELLAQAFAVNERYDDAYQALSRAIELDPDNQAYLQAMRQLKRAMGSKNE